MSGRVSEEALRREIVAGSRAVHARGWVANHDGNLSARLDNGRFLATPTAVSKGDVQPEWLIVVDQAGKVLSGTRGAFSEFALHAAAYAARPDIGVVLHAHPPTATGFAVAGVPIGHPFMAEAVVSLGAEIPVVPYALPKSPGWTDGLRHALGVADAVILDRHGVLTVGGSFEQALLRMELVEHLARVALVAHQLGGVRPLPAADVRTLTQKGRPASSPSHTPAPDQSPSPSRAAAGPPSGAVSGRRPDVSALVSDAMRRFS